MPKPTQQPAHGEEIDPALLARAARDDEHAWRIIEARVWSRVAIVLGTQSPDIEDIVQDTCIKIQRALRRGRGLRLEDASAAGWVATIALNTAIDHLRSQNRWATVYSYVGDPLALDAELDTLNYASIDVEDIMSLEDALLSLSDGHRLIVTLVHIDRYTCGEVAQLLGIPENTVKSRAARALEKLREYLQDAEDIEAQIGRLTP